MAVVLLIIIVLAILGPQWWVRWVINKHNRQLESIPGTGAELAEHLLKKFQLNKIEVNQTELGDHYDPLSKSVGLAGDNYNGKSLSAVAIAAHEVGHAIQDAENMPLFRWRGRLVKFAVLAEKFGVMAMMVGPVVGGIARIPHPMLVLFAIGIGSLLVGVIVHLVTLPVEWDASFNKALPILIKGQYIDESQSAAVRQILTAAALTYVAATLASILNIWRWLQILRR